MSTSSDNNTAIEPWQDPQIEPLVKIRNLSKYFDEAAALKDLSLDIYEGEFFALLGPSGCGKSTLLRILAGFENPTFGQVELSGESIVDIPVYQRRINMMFQSYALFPHMSVEQNIAFGLKQEKLTNNEIKARTDEVIEMVQLNDFVKRKPHQLSGGQQQRTALARSLVKRPKLLLLDEPLGALDKRLREQTQFQLVDLQESLNMTFIMVTHDQEEAMTMASRIAVMNQGEIAQIGTPIEVYESPNTRFTADFIGDINIIEGKILKRDEGKLNIYSAQEKNSFFINERARYAGLNSGDAVAYAIRPEKINITKDDAKKDGTKQDDANAELAINSIRGEVIDIGYLGNRSVYHVKLNSGQIIIASVNNHARQEFMDITWNDEVILSWHHQSALILI